MRAPKPLGSTFGYTHFFRNSAVSSAFWHLLTTHRGESLSPRADTD
jgi:hypothetical protein